MNPPQQLHYRACHLCEAMCGLEIAVEQGEVRSIRGDADDPLGRGHICPKAIAIQDIHRDPDRLKHPVRRTAQGWQRISWDEALDEVAAQILKAQKERGNDAVGIYLGNPNVHNYGSMLFGPSFIRSLRTHNRFSATSLDQLPHMLLASQMFGHQLLMPIPDVDRTDFFVIMGGNPLASNGSIMSAPDIKKRLKEIQARGKVVVIDPRCTETAELADQHIFIRPGSDAMLLLAVLQVIRQEGLEKPGKTADFCEGIEEFWRTIPAVTPEQAAPHTGVSAQVIRQLAREFAGASRAVWYGRMGVSTQAFGSLCQWLMLAINILTGRMDVPGGMMFPLPAFDPVGAKLAGRGRFGRWKSRVRGLPEFGGELPSAVIAEEILTPGDGQIRLMLTSAGNPVLSSPNGRRLDEAFASLDFMACIDIYINETTRHAHIILPPTTGLEHEHYDIAFHQLAIRNTARLSPQVFEPEDDTRHDWEILLELQTRIEAGRGQKLKAYAKRAMMRRLGPEGILDLGLRAGPYGSGWKLWQGGLTLRKLKQAPHGVDLGPLKPQLPKRLKTADGKIQMVPALMVEDLPRLQAHFANDGEADAPEDAGEGHRFLLIGRRHLRSCNSWMHNSERLVRGKDRCTLMMHPDDGASCGVSEGQQVQVRSRVGQVSVAVELTAKVMPGVVCLPHGWGHDREGTQLSTASKRPGVSINDITDHEALDAISGNAAFNGLPVWVSAEAGDA